MQLASASAAVTQVRLSWFELAVFAFQAGVRDHLFRVFFGEDWEPALAEHRPRHPSLEVFRGLVRVHVEHTVLFQNPVAVLELVLYGLVEGPESGAARDGFGEHS